MQAADPRAHAPDATPPEAERAAFRDLHGRRLHGFALLLTLGDRPRAARLAADAIAEGSANVDELRHPERAAAWLRARVVHGAHGISRGTPRLSDRLQALSQIDAAGGVLAGLTDLRLIERAALIASSVERLDRRDVALIVGKDGSALDALLSRARLRYARRFASVASETAPSGPVIERVLEVAKRAMA